MTEANKLKLLGEVCFLMARILPGSPVLLFGGNSLLRRPPRKRGPDQDKVRQRGSCSESRARTLYSVRLSLHMHPTVLGKHSKKKLVFVRNNSYFLNQWIPPPLTLLRTSKKLRTKIVDKSFFWRLNAVHLKVALVIS